VHDNACVRAAGAVAGIGGLGFLASKVDTGFADFFNAAIAKVGLLTGSAPPHTALHDPCAWVPAVVDKGCIDAV
jgi:hypothetical protein